MRKKTLSSKILTLLFVIFLSFSFLSLQVSGSSEDGEAKLIEDWYQLDEIRYDLDGDFELISDLTEDSAGYEELVDTEKGWEPIGNSTAGFTGNFDGSGNVIYDLYLNRTDEWSNGLFDHVEGEVKDLGLEEIHVRGDWYVGGLTGVNHGHIENTYTEGEVIGTGYDVGGLVGLNYGSMERSHSSADVTGDGARIGGLIGNHNNQDVVNCYASGEVEGNFQVGGLIGWTHFAQVSNSYAFGEVTGGGDLGGLVGQNWRGTIENSFWDMETSGQEHGAGTGKTTEEMKDVSTYTDTETEGLEDPWDFVGDPYDDDGDEDIWDIDEDVNDGYPFFPREEIEVSVDIDPDTLNLRSGGRWITAYIEASQEVDMDSVVLKNDGGEVAVEWGDDQEGVFMVKFESSEVQDIVESGEVRLTVQGNLVDGRPFIGFDTIVVVNPGRG